jgi:Amt family ammonium transporter
MAARSKGGKEGALSADGRIVWLACSGLLALAFPVGVGWMTTRGKAPSDGQGGQLLAVALLALFVAGTVGFSLLYGAVHFSSLGEEPRPSWQWEPFGEGSGLVAWGGIGTQALDTPARAALFLLEAAGTLSVVAIALAPALGKLAAPGWVAAAVAIAGWIYPLLGHWVWGGGWLAATGRTGYLGHGFVDPGGAGLHYALGGLLALAGLVATGSRHRGPARGGNPTPPAMLLTFSGMVWLQLGSTHTLSPELGTMALNTLASATAGGLAAALYMAFTTTRLRSDMLGRGLLAGTACAAGLAPLASTLTNVLAGAVAGCLACLGSYLIERVWKLEDSAGLVPAFGLGGLWGTLAVGLFADGRWGVGLNGIGATRYLGVPGQGVTGILFLAPGMSPDFGQLAAQVLGLAVIVGWGLGIGWLCFRLASIRTAWLKR